ncbi:MAG TPA: hypothetical protein VK420_14740, partial [Longimicrobium sp.]|nr:hypothetical protein [Longimicrobium sp.]
MRTPTLKRLAGTAALALALAACKDSTGSGPNPSGDLSFTFTGAKAGEFAASGAFDPDANDLPDYAAAFVVRGELVLIASDRLPSGRSNLFVLYAPPVTGVTTCTVTTAPNACFIRGEFLTGASSDPNQGNEGLFTGEVGTVEVTELANNRVRGTFTITLRGQGTVASEIEVRTGTFDAPFVSALQLDPNRGVLPPAAPPSFG